VRDPCAAGPGHVFQPPVPIKDMKWFPEALKLIGHFGLDVQEHSGGAVIDGLVQLAASARRAVS
jgi:hypothetical protein